MSKTSSARVAKDENRRRLKELMERYGSLLTEKQASMVRSYAVDGLSFSEVARKSGVSRQAVHESVRSAERVLSEYNDKLKHLAPTDGSDDPLPPSIMNSPDIGQVVSKLESLKMKIARTGIIYSVDWIRKEIDLVMGMLETEENAKPAGQQKQRNTEPET
jgi:predicted DNA-binding protein YlxM (UPF0122 family)